MWKVSARSRVNKARELLRRHGAWRVFDPYQTVNHGASTVAYCSVDRTLKTLRIEVEAKKLVVVLREALPGSADSLSPNQADGPTSLGGQRLARIVPDGGEALVEKKGKHKHDWDQQVLPEVSSWEILALLHLLVSTSRLRLAELYHSFNEVRKVTKSF